MNGVNIFFLDIYGIGGILIWDKFFFGLVNVGLYFGSVLCGCWLFDLIK